MAQGGLPGSKERSGIWNLKNIRNAQNNAEYGQSNLYDIELLLVGGGGAGGGWNIGGGGGAGGLVYANGLSVRRGCAYGITIGSGGSPSFQNDTINTRGANTTFCYTGGAQYPGSDVAIIALGGGGGGNGPGLPGGYFGPTEGGSGGGSGGYVPGQPGASNACGCPNPGQSLQRRPEYWGYLPGIMGFGNDGGIANTLAGANKYGGGGGAGGKGGDARTHGGSNGGRGLTFSISGSAVGYAGGGPGGGDYSCIHNGGFGYDGAACAFEVTPVPGGNPGSYGAGLPTANRGAGASGINTYQGPNPHIGATGIAIIKYAGFQKGTGGNSCTTCVGAVAVNTIHTFTGSGTFTA
jgi:hypothetical protein